MKLEINDHGISLVGDSESLSNHADICISPSGMVTVELMEWLDPRWSPTHTACMNLTADQAELLAGYFFGVASNLRSVVKEPWEHASGSD